MGEISKKVQESRLKWYEHVLRREEEYVGKIVKVMEVPGKSELIQVWCSFKIALLHGKITHDFLYFGKSSSSSGVVFVEKVGCHDPTWLPILSQSHELFVSHSRPFCDVCHPLRSWPSSASFPLQWTL